MTSPRRSVAVAPTARPAIYVAGVTVGLALFGWRPAAIIAAVLAVALALSALVWAFRKDHHR